MKLICKKCEDAKHKYSVTYGGVSARTMMAFQPFVDGELKRHFHDGNTGGCEIWRCSNGHEIAPEVTASCWCGWPVSGAWVKPHRDKQALDKIEDAQ